MKTKTETDIEALEDSIKHWERMRDDIAGCVERGECPTTKHCACCRIYFDDRCRGCPIREAIKQDFCCGTPYSNANSLFYLAADPVRSDGDSVKKWKEAAQDEINFLKMVKKKLEQKT